MEAKKRFQSEALQIAYRAVIGDDPKRPADFEEELIHVEAAQLIYDMRTKAGLSQQELAKRLGATAQVISNLENADYDGHTLAEVRRIAAALNCRLELRAVPLNKKSPAAAKQRR